MTPMEPLTVNWAGGEHAMRLGMGELLALQEACDAGPRVLFLRLQAGVYRVADPVETVRLALIGGGMERAAAGRAVSAAVDARGLDCLVPPAELALGRALWGPSLPDDDAEPEPDDEEEGAPGKAAGAGSGAPQTSTAAAP